MHSSVKKFFLIFIILIIIVGVLFGKEIKRATSIVINPVGQSIVSTEVFDLPVTLASRVYGNPGAAITIDEFIDLGDDKSRALNLQLTQFVSAHPTEARLVWHDLPRSGIFSADNESIHRAAWCANKQQKFWDYVGVLMTDKKYLSAEGNITAAQQMGLDFKTWNLCLNDTVTQQQMQTENNTAGRLGLRFAPVLFINNKQINLTVGLDLGQMLNALITK